MPRRDVPYPGVICSLKERIAEIADALKTKLHSINGIEGDADGDVQIVSDHPAVIITQDQIHHKIEIGLDNSELPAAAVTSVNGETGTVVLDASEIPYNDPDGYTDDVEEKLNVLTGVQNSFQLSLNQERTRAQNAENALQTNINAVQAGIPAAAAAAVAADPTVTQLAADVPNKLDKITSGSSLKAYTHTGATQDDTPVVDGTDANSIGIRDANGRMKAADPANGATDKTLVTANWVSQSGNTSPNNLIHKTGFETMTPKILSGNGNSVIESVGWNGGLSIRQTVGNLDVGVSSAIGGCIRWFNSAGNVEVGHLVVSTDAQGNALLVAVLKNKDGVTKYITIASSA